MVDILKRKINSGNDQVIFSYVGKPSHEMMNSILEMSESKLKIIETRSTIVKRIVNVLIEILQNIFNHGEDFSVIDHQSFKYSLAKSGSDYFISTENFIKTANVKGLVNKLNSYLALNDEDLTNTYRKTLVNGDFTTKGGAGLGLIHIIRKTGGNLDYKFSKVDRVNSLFQLNVQIKAE
jgi:hypothetical protein